MIELSAWFILGCALILAALGLWGLWHALNRSEQRVAELLEDVEERERENAALVNKLSKVQGRLDTTAAIERELERLESE